MPTIYRGPSYDLPFGCCALPTVGPRTGYSCPRHVPVTPSTIPDLYRKHLRTRALVEQPRYRFPNTQVTLQTTVNSMSPDPFCAYSYTDELPIDVTMTRLALPLTCCL